MREVDNSKYLTITYVVAIFMIIFIKLIFF